MMSLRRPRTFLILSFLLIYFSVRGQTGDRQSTDTITSDTVVVGSEERSGANGQIDSADVAGADTSGVGSDSLLARTIPDSVMKAWKGEPHFAYANDPRYWNQATEENDGRPAWLISLLGSAAFRYGIYLFLGALLVYAIGRIISENQLGIFYRRGTKKTNNREAGTDDESLNAEDMDRRLQQALDTKDYRQAIRYSYLRLLRQMDERGLIRYHGQATDQEYLRQLAGTSRESPFRFLTYAYEKVWYGKFDLSEETFRRLTGYFTEFEKTIQG